MNGELILVGFNLLSIQYSFAKPNYYQTTSILIGYSFLKAFSKGY